VIESMGGSIKVKSKLGVGTEFIITLDTITQFNQQMYEALLKKKKMMIFVNKLWKDKGFATKIDDRIKQNHQKELLPQ
jgi:hypothetical protein